NEGRVRAWNEDACLFRTDGDAAMAVVADGMGGQSSGRPAADQVIAACGAAFASRAQDYAEAWWHGEHNGQPQVLWSALPLADREAVDAQVRAVRASRAPVTLGDLAIVEREGEVLVRTAVRALSVANQAICSGSATNPMLRGQGSTGVLALFAPGTVALAWVG